MLELGVDQVQVSIYSHLPEVHDGVTKLPGSLQRSVEAIRFLTAQGLRVVIANVLMTANLRDSAGVQALARELGVPYTLDPTITPKMDGDTSILNLRIPGAELTGVFHNESLVGNVEEFCAPPPPPDEDVMGGYPCSAGHTARLHLPLRRCFSLRAVPTAQRQRAAAEIHRNLGTLFPS